MREKKGGALQKLKKRLSHSFGRLSEYHHYIYQYYYTAADRFESLSSFAAGGAHFA